MDFCSSLSLIIFQFILSYIHQFSHPSHFFHIWSINKSCKCYFLSIPSQQSPSCKLKPLLSLLCIQSIQLVATPWTAAHQTPLSTEFFRQGYWSGLPFPPLPEDLPDPGIRPASVLCFLRCQADSLPLCCLGTCY